MPTAATMAAEAQSLRIGAKTKTVFVESLKPQVDRP